MFRFDRTKLSDNINLVYSLILEHDNLHKCLLTTEIQPYLWANPAAVATVNVSGITDFDYPKYLLKVSQYYLRKIEQMREARNGAHFTAQEVSKTNRLTMSLCSISIIFSKAMSFLAAEIRKSQCQSQNLDGMASIGSRDLDEEFGLDTSPSDTSALSQGFYASENDPFIEIVNLDEERRRLISNFRKVKFL